jgi:hypothetical protein
MERITNPNSTGLDLSNQFLTGDEAVQAKQRQATPNMIIPQQPLNAMGQKGMPVPDLHKSTEVPTTHESREEIRANIPPINLREAILDEQLNQEVASAKIENRNSPIDGKTSPKDVLKYLIARGDYQDSFNLYGAKWTMRALDNRDVLLAFDEMKDDIQTQAGRISALMFAQVMYSIEAINGVTLPDWFPEVKSKDYDSREAYMVGVRHQLRKYLEHMPSSVIDTLYMEYTKIDTARNKALEEIKN